MQWRCTRSAATSMQWIFEGTGYASISLDLSIANVAVRAILDRPAVAGVIVGTRLGLAEHRADNARVFAFSLDDEDRTRLDAVLETSRDLYRAIGDCGDEYRR